MQQPPLAKSHLILGNSLVRILQNLRTSWIAAVMVFSSPAVSDGGIDDHGQNRGRNESNMHKQRDSDTEEAQ